MIRSGNTGLLTVLLAVAACGGPPDDILPNTVAPTPQQIQYQRMEFIGFVHFTVNTFTDREWGFGDESPDLFNPTSFDANQWASVAAEVGMKELILTAKHHDGFCLWPSAYTDFSVRSRGLQAKPIGRQSTRPGLWWGTPIKRI